MGRTVDAAIGRIRAAEGLDKPGHTLGKAISRTGQVASRPSERLANALHGHPARPIAVTIPIGTWTSAFGLDLLAAAGLLRGRGASRAAALATLLLVARHLPETRVVACAPRTAGFLADCRRRLASRCVDGFALWTCARA